MIGLTKHLIKSAFALVFTAALVYGIFFVPIGSYTLAQHAWRIGNTEEAKTLGHSLKKSAHEVEQTLNDGAETANQAGKKTRRHIQAK